MKRVQPALQDSEINSTISSFFDGSWAVAIGDDAHGWLATDLATSLEEAEAWLDEKAIELFPGRS
jgi:hypothetical protein